MQSPQIIDYKNQIEEAAKKAKCKKVFYIYDESGNRQLLGVFSKKRAAEIKKYLQRKKLLNRVTEYEVKTTEPDSSFSDS